MSLNPILYILALCALPFMVHAQEIPDEGGEAVYTKEQVQAFKEQQRLDNLFLDATKAKIADNPEKAFELYMQVAQQDPKNDAAHHELARLYYLKGEINKSVAQAEMAYQLSPRNKWYRETLASLYTQNGMPEKALPMYEALYRENPLDQEYLQQLVNQYILLNKPQEAIKVYDEYEKSAGITEEVSMRKHQLYLATKKDKKALTELEKLAAANAWDSRILSTLAEFYLHLGKNNEALNTYQQIKTIDPENAYINISLADFYRQQGDLKKATEALKAGFRNPYLDSDTKIQVLISYYSQVKDYPGIEDDLLELTGILAELHPNEPKALSLRGEILMSFEKFAEARDLFARSSELDPSRYETWQNLLLASNNLEDFVRLGSDSKKVTELFPLQPLPYFFNGWSMMELKQYDSSIASLNKGVKLVASNHPIKVDFYSLLGSVYYSAGQTDASYEAYAEALRLQPDNVGVLNNYAYNLALESRELEKANTMAGKAVELEPENEYYLDTYAWVLYKQKNYTKSLIYIEKAITASAEVSDTVWEHYGDILFQLNRTEDALVAWKNAAKAGEGSSFLKQKIAEGLLYE
ncbi:MAG: tetratricopeptide repeat protein [Lentimicrobium sp.]|nr:tetratricopeptide repeat protein [Lentimicrobium sp.]